MPSIPLAVIGAGQAGLAVSQVLGEAGVEHVVLERGRVAERWRARRRWRSLRLLTPNWMTRLPGWSYGGPEPDGYMTAGEVAGFLGRYADSMAAPVVEHAAVRSVRRVADGYRVVTEVGTWSTDAVVLATGWSDVPRVPDVAARLDPGLHQLTPDRYRDPTDLPDGGVLIVGASATGVQLADELARAGRRVVVAAGRHSPLPRRYRGVDIMRWLDVLGVNRRDLDHVSDRATALQEPSLQLAGRPDQRDVHLAALQALGVHIVGRLSGADGERVVFAADLPVTTAAADVRLRRLLARIDARAGESRRAFAAPVPPVLTAGAVTDLNLRAAGIRTVVWATGYRRAYPWLHVPVLGPAGDIRHQRGRTDAPGLFVVGTNWQSHRGSMTLDGVGHDAAHVAAQALAHLRRPSGQRVAA